jgi:hypothetical protein
MFRLSFPGVNSPLLHRLQDAVPTSILVGLQQPVSVLLQLQDVDHPLQATADPSETLIHTDQDLCRDRALQDATEPAHDRFLRALDHHQDDEEGDGETALVATAAGEDEVLVIAATAVMMIGAGAEAVDGEVVADVRGL